MADVLVEWSNALEARAAAARALVVAVRVSRERHVTGTRWTDDGIVVSEQSLPRGDGFIVVLPDGTSAEARVAGRDPGTNVALLRLAAASAHAAPAGGAARAGALALAHGADGDGRITTRIGVVNHAGSEWVSSAGGRIDQRIVLDLRLSTAEEGGPVFDASGACLGVTAFGPRGQVLVIPGATIDRVVPALVAHGRVARGWLGVALQAVAVPDPLRAQSGAHTGLMVMSLADNGPAQRAGVVAGDIVIGMNGAPTPRVRSVARALGPESIGRNTDLTLIRGGSIVAVSAAIEARPAS